MVSPILQVMKSKKTDRADLEPKRPIFLEVGMLIALGLVLLAFQWKSYAPKELELGTREASQELEEVILPTKQEIKIPLPLAPMPTTTVINIVEDDVVVEEDLVIDAEVDEFTEIEEYVPPVEEIEELEEKEEEIFMIVEVNPAFPGGEKARLKFLRDHLNYPIMARETNIQGIVYVTFVVEADGRVTQARVIRGIGGGCDEEALRVVNLMPLWSPGKQRGKAVRVQFSMPIRFNLQK